jgi:hypothetical protein
MSHEQAISILWVLLPGICFFSATVATNLSIIAFRKILISDEFARTNYDCYKSTMMCCLLATARALHDSVRRKFSMCSDHFVRGREGDVNVDCVMNERNLGGDSASDNDNNDKDND